MTGTDKLQTGGISTFVVKVAGDYIPDIIEILSIEVEMAVNKIASARIVVLDGNPATGNFEASSSDTFVPGNEIIIEAGYDSKNTQIFKGIITKQRIKVNGSIGSCLEVECNDVAIKMAVGPKNITFSKKKDSDIITSIIGNYSGLTNKVTATTMEWPKQLQYNISDWDFILSRAEANGLIVTNINGKIAVIKPDATTTSVLEVTYGNNLIEFNAEVNSINQLGAVKASSWDYKSQAIIAEKASNNHAGPGNLSSKKLSEVIGLSDYDVQTTSPLESGNLTDWAKAQLIKSEYAKIQGKLKVQGTHLTLPGTYISLNGLGDRMNGDHIVGGITHSISEGNWFTEVTIGLPNNWITEKQEVMAPLSSGLLSGVRGLFNGTVKKMYDDPDNQYRVLVDVPLFDTNGEGIWARLTNLYATSGAGMFFMPEVGDEVIVGFLNEDTRFPIILGSVYSSTKVKPASDYVAAEKNPKKAIVSKAGITVEFDDEKKIFIIKTPSNNTIILSDMDKKVTIADQNNNSIIMSSQGIEFKSAGNITFAADQKIEIKGEQGIKVASSGGDVETTGMNIKESADMQYSAEGSMTAQVHGGTELTLKGAMVMIN